jgi:hypothetical protein
MLVIRLGGQHLGHSKQATRDVWVSAILNRLSKATDYLMSRHRARLYNGPITGYGAIVFRGWPPVALTLFQPR